MYSETLSSAVLLFLANIGCTSTCLFHEPALRSYVETLPQKLVQSTAVLKQKRQARTGVPLRLRIPRISVDAVIEPVGITSEGEMAVPQHPDTVGWYDLGTRPGEKGSAVLAGHLDWYHGETAVFHSLDILRAGDVLSVETDKGNIIRFVVREIRTFRPDDVTPDLFLNDDGKHLNLVTCSGAWDTTRKNYSERLVVFADAVVRK